MRYEVYVKPNSKKGPLVEVENNGKITIYIRESAIDGKANEAVIKLMAKNFNVSKNQVKIIRGYKSKRKLIEIINK